MARDMTKYPEGSVPEDVWSWKRDARAANVAQSEANLAQFQADMAAERARRYELNQRMLADTEAVGCLGVVATVALPLAAVMVIALVVLI